MRKKPWIRKKRELVSKNKWFSLYKDTVVRPDGREGNYNLLKFRDGVSVIALDEKDRVYLIREFSYPFGKYILQSVKGGIDDGDTPIEAAKSELKEELGIVASNWIPMGEYFNLTSYGKISSHMFLATGLLFEKQTLGGTEIIEPVIYSLDEAVDMALNCKIDNAITALLILKIKNYLKNSRESK